MRAKARVVLTILGMGLGSIIPNQMVFADAQSFKQLSAQWWQWALSIPTSINPLLDATGANCMVGQSGSVWFLAGTFNGRPATRACAVPADKVIYFPVINSVNINAPNVCGQGPDNVPVHELRAISAASIDAVTNLSVELDNQPIKNVHRVHSEVFEIALPEDNVFDAPCSGLGNVPAGVFSPGVDDGFYVRLNPLPVGNYTLHVHAESPGNSQDTTYNLTVVPVLVK